MALVAARRQRVVQIVHDPHGVEIDRVLVLEAVLLVARNEGEIVNVAVQVGQRKLDLVARRGTERLRRLFRLQVEQGDPGESRRR